MCDNVLLLTGHAVAQLVETVCYKPGRSRVRFPYGITGICYLFNPSGLSMALGSTQPPTEMSTRHIS